MNDRGNQSPNGSGGSNGNNKGDNKKNANRMSMIISVISALIMVIGFMWVMKDMESKATEEITYNEFIQYLEEGKIDRVEVNADSGRLLIIPKNQPYKDAGMLGMTFTYYTGLLEDGNLLQQRLEDSGVEYIRVTEDTSSFILSLLVNIGFPILMLVILSFSLSRMIGKAGGGMMGVGKSTAKVYVEKETGVTFKDVAGQEEAKDSIRELVDFLHNPQKYAEIGAKLPKGALLVGPPGTGKTLLAKAVAGEAKVPFFSLSGSDFVEMYVGVGASRVRDLFKQAQAMAPCIIFIDEIDAIGKSRDSRYGGNDEREQTLNQLLAEMDGFDTSKGIVILAATNRPEVLDKALLRPGRFDRRVIVDKPDLKGRLDILKVHAKHVLMHDSVDLEAIALATSGAVGSDLANMINEAAILAVKCGRKYVTQEDLFESVEVVIAGKEKKDRILSKEEKRVVAYHEVGHAMISMLKKESSEPVQKITIVPRTMGSLGYVLQAPEEEKYLMTKDEMLTRIVTFCAGRASEEIFFSQITTGAANDIEQATRIARAMITRYGMSDTFGMVGLETVENQYLDGRAVLQCGDETAAEIDRELRTLMKECYAQAKSLLLENQHVVKEIAEFLCEKESITGKEFVDIYNRVTGKSEIAEGEEIEVTAADAPEEAEATAEGAEQQKENSTVQPKIEVLADEQIIIADDTPNEENNV
ncbi:MAG: ATP-dependent zinc metalloprotease FtsH [Lachnospiraceae bacterium]|nr:ATP-dependent zinc metalloprotease FtsH [Lachnospiraceae bacterium]